MIKFGTGGWRAIIGEDFTKRNLQTLALAMCMKMEDEQVSTEGIVIGYDRRFLSEGGNLLDGGGIRKAWN